jgi:two-component system NarL family response regulator
MRVLPELVHRCMSASAEGFIMKDVMPAELAAAVKMVAEGHSYVDPRAAGKLLRNRGASRGDFFDLSNRELDIIKLVAEGLSNKEISSRLHLSEKTVKNHMGRIFSKLNISARSQAAIYAIKNGLI